MPEWSGRLWAVVVIERGDELMSVWESVYESR